MIDASKETKAAPARPSTGLSKSITDGVDEFYGLSDERFAQLVHEFTRNDPRLSLLFFATRQQYQKNRATLEEAKW